LQPSPAEPDFRWPNPSATGGLSEIPEQARAGAAKAAGAGQNQQLNELPLQPIALPQDGLQPAQHPPAPRAPTAKPRAGASGWSVSRRRGKHQELLHEQHAAAIGLEQGQTAPQALRPSPTPFTSAQLQFDRQPAWQLMQRPDQRHQPAHPTHVAVQPEPAGEFPRAGFHGCSAKEHRSRNPGPGPSRGPQARGVCPRVALYGPGSSPKGAAEEHTCPPG